jgi:hypothetical protein
VKTHLSRLYEKTGTRRQADLVKLVAGFVNPFLDWTAIAAKDAKHTLSLLENPLAKTSND